jgi:hypothetical protein
VDAADAPVWGDIDDSGAVDGADAVLGYRALTGAISLTAAQQARANVAPLVGGQPQGAFDDDFTLADQLLIVRKAIGAVSF